MARIAPGRSAARLLGREFGAKRHGEAARLLHHAVVEQRRQSREMVVDAGDLIADRARVEWIEHRHVEHRRQRGSRDDSGCDR